MKPEAVSGKLIVTVMPNPASYFFTLDMQSTSHEKIQIVVTDVTGRIIERKSDVSANSTLQIGSTYHQGVYFAEVFQGKERVILQLIKGRK